MTIVTEPRLLLGRIARILFLLATLVVWVLSLLPAPDLPNAGISDKLEHVIAYFVLATLGSLAFRGRRNAFLLFVLLCVMGVAIELLQNFSPGRSPELADAVADGIGAAAGVVTGAAFAFVLSL